MIGYSHPMNLWSITWPWWACQRERRTKWELLPRMEMDSKQHQSGSEFHTPGVGKFWFQCYSRFYWITSDQNVTNKVRVGLPLSKNLLTGVLQSGGSNEGHIEKWRGQMKSGGWTPSIPSNLSTANVITYCPYFACCILNQYSWCIFATYVWLPELKIKEDLVFILLHCKATFAHGLLVVVQHFESSGSNFVDNMSSVVKWTENCNHALDSSMSLIINKFQ